MSGFMYFRSGETGAMRVEAAAKLGVSYALDTGDALTCADMMSNTPSGKQGTLFAVAKRLCDKQLTYSPDAQTWRKLPKIDVWVGIWDDAKPTPDSLARSKQISGDRVKLDDGQFWTVPRVLQFDSNMQRYASALPTRWDYDDDGNWVRGSVVEEHAHLFALAVPYANERFAIDNEENVPTAVWNDTQILTDATTLLQTNYVVSQAEMVILGAMVTDSSVGLVPLVACDYLKLASWLEDQKKSESAEESTGSDTSAGNAA